MRNIMITIAATTAALAVPSFASAQNYGYAPPSQACQQSLNNNRLAGGVIGGVAGAVLGKQIAGRNARSEGQVLGAVVGAVAGSEIARRRVACDDFAYRGNQPVRQSSYQNNGFYNGNFDNAPVHNDRAFQTSYRAPVQARQQCGWGEQSIRNPNGRFQTQQVWMCQANDGNWYPSNR